MKYLDISMLDTLLYWGEVEGGFREWVGRKGGWGWQKRECLDSRGIGQGEDFWVTNSWRGLGSFSGWGMGAQN